MALSSATLLPSSSSLFRFHPLSSATPRRTAAHPKMNRSGRIAASHGENYGGGGRMVDEGMVVLRKRIHEAKMAEHNYQPPEHWMEWEKRYYTRYDSIVCALAGALQSRLMETRPSLALAAVALVALSVPTSTALLALRFVEITQALLAAGVHQAGLAL